MSFIGTCYGESKEVIENRIIIKWKVFSEWEH